MDHTPQQALIPLEQAIIEFHGNEVLAVHLSDDRVAATLHALCAILAILPHGQIQRIRRDEKLADHLLHALVETSGGLQLMDVLIAESVPDWVMGLQLKRIALEKRPLILALKMEIVAVLYHHFFPEQATHPRAAPQKPSTRPIRQEAKPAPVSLWDRLFEVLYEMRQKEEARDEQFTTYQRAVDERFSVAEEWLRSLDRHVARIDQGNTGPVSLPLLISAIFSLLEQPTGRTQKQLEQEMIETFRVLAINALPDEQWEDVLAWGLWRARQPN